MMPLTWSSSRTTPRDDTRRRLREYARTRPHVRLIDADGLDALHPRRGDRLAVARNIYMEALRKGPMVITTISSSSISMT
jgi:hypothetical protein